MEWNGINLEKLGKNYIGSQIQHNACNSISSGTVALWNLLTKSLLQRVCQPDGSLKLYPFRCFLAHDHAVSNIQWCKASRWEGCENPLIDENQSLSFWLLSDHPGQAFFPSPFPTKFIVRRLDQTTIPLYMLFVVRLQSWAKSFTSLTWGSLTDISGIWDFCQMCSASEFWPACFIPSNFMVTTGNDRKIKFWDLRRLHEPINSIKRYLSTEIAWLLPYSGITVAQDSCYAS